MKRRELLQGTAMGVAAALAARVPAAARQRAAGALRHPESPELRRIFQSPPKTYRPMVRWYWPGGDVRDDELRREIRLLDEAGFGGAEIQPFRFGLNPRAPEPTRRRVDDFLSPGFFAHVRAAVDEAVRRDMWIDCTFGSGWPFGGGMHITPELALLEMRSARLTVRGPTSHRGAVPWPERSPGFATLFARLTETPDRLPQGWGERLAARERLVAVVAVRGEEAVIEQSPDRDLVGNPIVTVKRPSILGIETAIDLTHRVRADRTLEWEVSDGTWQLFTFVQRAADARVLAGVGSFPQLVLDHLNARALDTHLAVVGGAMREHLGRYFGKGLRAVFCDSLELAASLYWTEGFLEEFRRRRGYDLVPLLPLLGTPGYEADASAPVQRDYLRTVSDLLIDNFYEPFAAWARRHGLLARVQAHDAPADVQRAYGTSDIPETESLYAGGRYDFLKLAASASHVYGRSITASESFVWIGQEYQTTPEKLKRFADKLITAGVNQIVYGGFPYEYMDRPEPGWYPFVSPFPYSSHLNHHNPFWPFLAPLNAYFTRLQSLSQLGRNVAPVAVLRTSLDYEAPARQSTRGRIEELLLQNGYAFDHINAHALLQSRVQEGRLVTPGGARYDILIAIDERTMAVELAERLEELASARLPLLMIGQPPIAVDGYFDRARRSAAVQDIMKRLLGVRDLATLAQAVDVPPGAAIRYARTATDALPILREAVAPNLRFAEPAPSVFFTQTRIGDIETYFFRNASTEAVRVTVELPGRLGAAPEWWDPWTGGMSAVRDVRRIRDGTAVPLELDPYGSRLLVFDPSSTLRATTAPPRATGPVPPPIAIGGGQRGWSLRAVGRDATGAETRHDLELTDLVDWSTHSTLRHFSGKGTYTIAFRLSAGAAERYRIELDLGRVGDVAQVRVNGREGPTLFMRPYRADISTLVRPGENILEITVTNALLNRLLGSGMELGIVLGTLGRRPEPLPAGLLGPVRLVLSHRPTG